MVLLIVDMSDLHMAIDPSRECRVSNLMMMKCLMSKTWQMERDVTYSGQSISIEGDADRARQVQRKIYCVQETDSSACRFLSISGKETV